MKKLGKYLLDYHYIIIIVVVLLFPLVQSFSFQNLWMRGVNVTNEFELRAAIDLGDRLIVINDMIDLESYIQITNHVTIQGSGTITVADQHRHFIVEDGGELTLQGNVVLTRKNDYTGHGGGVSVVSGAFIMKGGYITGNDWWIMPEAADFWFGGTGANSGNGGGVILSGSGVFRFYQGTISENRAIHGGGVYTIGFGRLIMHGGYISDNQAKLGGGVYTAGYFMGNLPFGSTNGFQMYGGRISNNVAQFIGGGVYENWSNIGLYGGQISNNNATSDGGVYALRANINTQMRIFNNEPTNFNDTHHLLFWQIITPTPFRLLVVFVVAIIGYIHETKCRTRASRTLS